MRKRTISPRFAASGRRFGPYFARRWEIVAASRPFSVLEFSRRTTSSTARACHAVASLPVVEIVAAFMCNPPTRCVSRPARRKIPISRVSGSPVAFLPCHPEPVSLLRQPDVIPLADDRFVAIVVFEAEHAHASRLAIEQLPGDRRQPEPASGD